jgi:hypothetical protein
MNGWGATRFRKGLRASEDDAAMHSHANKRSVELKYVKLRNFFDARALQQTNSTKCGPVHIQHSERGLRYLRVREYHDWKVSPALCVPRTDAAHRTTLSHPELVAPARPVATAAPLLEDGPGNLGPIEGRIKMRFKNIATLFVVSIVILTGSPALAAQIARHDGYCRSCGQKVSACRDRTFGTCVGRESDAPRWNGGNTTHDDWSARMILG